jgi:hypothetical protein
MVPRQIIAQDLDGSKVRGGRVRSAALAASELEALVLILSYVLSRSKDEPNRP